MYLAYMDYDGEVHLVPTAQIPVYDGEGAPKDMNVPLLGGCVYASWTNGKVVVWEPEGGGYFYPTAVPKGPKATVTLPESFSCPAALLRGNDEVKTWAAFVRMYTAELVRIKLKGEIAHFEGLAAKGDRVAASMMMDVIALLNEIESGKKNPDDYR